ncbi:MAG: polyphosphate kinase 1 [Cytophagales bacterium]|nr:polyphosphate kinase 1 [Cytophagales bacterium]
MPPFETLINKKIEASHLISRDLSWIRFNERVLDQARNAERSLIDRLKFLAITGSNLDEFFMVRVGSLYNYLDYGKTRTDYSELDEFEFKQKLFEEVKLFTQEQHSLYENALLPLFSENGISIERELSSLQPKEIEEIKTYFKQVVYPMLTPMVYDDYHTFPVLTNKVLIFGVVTKDEQNKKNDKKLSLVQIPQNLSRFYVIERKEQIIFVPIDVIIRRYIHKLFRNIDILSISLFRITRNGDFTLEESEDIDINFLEELRLKLKSRKTGRVVRVEAEENIDELVYGIFKERWDIEDDNIFLVNSPCLLDYTRLWEIVNFPKLRFLQAKKDSPKRPISLPPISDAKDLFEVLKKRDVLLHHPYNSFDLLTNFLEECADDPQVLSIKLTIYRLANNSKITKALLRAAENGKHVSVLFEVKARFDEENNMREAQKLQNAGCFVIYGISHLKTHTKLMLIVRKEPSSSVTRYVHMSSGNYNEDTAKLYTDFGILSTKETYANDVSEFFNVITGHSSPSYYKSLITAPKGMRKRLIQLIRTEAENAQKELPSGIIIKINSLQDRQLIEELYKASQTGVQVKLIVRGICCLRPERKGLSDNITVRSIVGNFLEHSRIYYFHNHGKPRVFGGSADVMVRSFDRRLESLFEVHDPLVKKEIMTMLKYNLKDNVNSYILHENGSFSPCQKQEGEEIFNIHKEFYRLTKKEVKDTVLF